MNFATEFPFLYYSKCVAVYAMLCLCITNTLVSSFLGHAQKKNKSKLCESGDVVIVFARKMCNIRFSDGSRFQRRTPIFNFFFHCFSFFQSVPQVTKCLLVLRVTRKSQNIH